MDRAEQEALRMLASARQHKSMARASRRAAQITMEALARYCRFHGLDVESIKEQGGDKNHGQQRARASTD